MLDVTKKIEDCDKIIEEKLNTLKIELLENGSINIEKLLEINKDIRYFYRWKRRLEAYKNA